MRWSVAILVPYARCETRLRPVLARATSPSLFLRLLRGFPRMILARRAIARGQLGHPAREQQQRDQVGRRHRRVGDVAEAPDQLEEAARRALRIERAVEDAPERLGDILDVERDRDQRPLASEVAVLAAPGCERQ